MSVSLDEQVINHIISEPQVFAFNDQNGYMYKLLSVLESFKNKPNELNAFLPEDVKNTRVSDLFNTKQPDQKIQLMIDQLDDISFPTVLYDYQHWSEMKPISRPIKTKNLNDNIEFDLPQQIGLPYQVDLNKYKLAKILNIQHDQLWIPHKEGRYHQITLWLYKQFLSKGLLDYDHFIKMDYPNGSIAYKISRLLHDLNNQQLDTQMAKDIMSFFDIKQNQTLIYVLNKIASNKKDDLTNYDIIQLDEITPKVHSSYTNLFENIKLLFPNFVSYFDSSRLKPLIFDKHSLENPKTADFINRIKLLKFNNDYQVFSCMVNIIANLGLNENTMIKILLQNDDIENVCIIHQILNTNLAPLLYQYVSAKHDKSGFNQHLSLDEILSDISNVLVLYKTVNDALNQVLVETPANLSVHNMMNIASRFKFDIYDILSYIKYNSIVPPILKYLILTSNAPLQFKNLIYEKIPIQYRPHQYIIPHDYEYSTYKILDIFTDDLSVYYNTIPYTSSLDLKFVLDAAKTNNYIDILKSITNKYYLE